MDVSNIIPSKEKGKILAAVYETDKVNYEYFDNEFKSLMQDIKAKVPGEEVSIVSTSDDGQVLFISYSDKSMGTYYFMIPKQATWIS